MAIWLARFGRRTEARTGEDLDAMRRLDHCATHERSAHLRHLPRDYSLASQRWLRPSFLIVETQDKPGQQAEGVRTKSSASVLITRAG
jgi:hypothetical protein